MPNVRRMKLLYAAASVSWLLYTFFKLFNVSGADRNPNMSGLVYCLLLIGILPAALGYVLLFTVVPLLGRTLRRSQS